MFANLDFLKLLVSEYEENDVQFKPITYSLVI